MKIQCILIVCAKYLQLYTPFIPPVESVITFMTKFSLFHLYFSSFYSFKCLPNVFRILIIHSFTKLFIRCQHNQLFDDFLFIRKCINYFRFYLLSYCIICLSLVNFFLFIYSISLRFVLQNETTI